MIALAVVAVAAGAFLTALVGFAFGIVVLPTLLVIGMPLPAAVFTVLTIGGLTRIPDLWVGRSLIDHRRLGLLVTSCLAGSVPGFVLVAFVPEDTLRVFAGVLCLVAVVLQAMRTGPVRPTTPLGTTQFGIAGGVLGPTVGLSGVPASLLYLRAHVCAKQTIAELSGYFIVTNAVMLAVLVALERGLPVEASVTLVLLGAGIVGTAIGGVLARRVSQRLFRQLTIAAALASGVACLIFA